jgi:hypothetical protein
MILVATSLGAKIRTWQISASEVPLGSLASVKVAELSSAFRIGLFLTNLFQFHNWLVRLRPVTSSNRRSVKPQNKRTVCVAMTPRVCQGIDEMSESEL